MTGTAKRYGAGRRAAARLAGMLAAAAALAPAAPALADGVQASLGVNVTVLDLCAASSAFGAAAALGAPCLARMGAVVAVERPTPGAGPGRAGASPVTVERESAPAGPGFSYVTVIY